MTQPTAALGPLIRTYGKSRSFLFVWWTLAVLFAAAGALVLSLVPGPGSTVRFDGNVSLLYGTAAGAFGLAVLFVVVPWLLTRSQPTYHLHEKGVRYVGPQGDRTDLYQDIEDLYVFDYGGFAYRATPQAPWCSAGGRVSALAELTQRLRALHAEHRAERLYQALLAGQTVSFRCLSDQVAFSKSVVASRNMDHATYPLELNCQELKIQGKAIPLQAIDDIRRNDWIEKSSIVDTEGRVLHTMHPTAVMSFDVLYTLLARLQSATPQRA